MLFPFSPGGFSPDQIFNFAEGWLWTIIALVFAIQANRKTNKYQKLAVFGSLAFFAFGVSDFIEFTTGAWYRPWSLFVFKALCVLGFLLLLRQYSIAKRHENKYAERADAVNPHACGTFGTSAAEQPLVPKASGDT